MCFHPCIPPQQISPSAASRSPYPSATVHASRNVSAMRFVFAAGFSAQDAGPTAESMRTTPYLRTPRSRSFLPMAQALRTWVRKASAFLLGSHGGPAAERRPHRRDQRAGYEVVRSQFFRESLEIVVR